MAKWWGDKSNDKPLPPELEGKSPEDVVKVLKEKDELTAKLAKLEEDRVKEHEQVVRMGSEFETIKARLADAEANRKPPENKTEMLANFVEDGDTAFAQRIAPLADVTIRSAVMTARMLAQQALNNQDAMSPVGAKTIDGRLFQAWQMEIDNYAKGIAPAGLATPDAWIHLYYRVKGSHADELANPTIRKEKYNFLEPGSSGVAPLPEKRSDDTLTAQELQIAEKMKVSPENYLKRKKSMQLVNA